MKITHVHFMCVKLPYFIALHLSLNQEEGYIGNPPSTFISCAFVHARLTMIIVSVTTLLASQLLTGKCSSVKT